MRTGSQLTLSMLDYRTCYQDLMTHVPSRLRGRCRTLRIAMGEGGYPPREVHARARAQARMHTTHGLLYICATVLPSVAYLADPPARLLSILHYAGHGTAACNVTRILCMLCLYSTTQVVAVLRAMFAPPHEAAAHNKALQEAWVVFDPLGHGDACMRIYL